MEKGSSPLDTLRQLRELLDAGTITPQEFETLKGRLLAEQPAPPTVPLNPTFTAPTTTPETPTSVRPEPETAPPAAPSPANGPAEELPPLLDFFKQPSTPTSPPQPPAAPVSPDKPAYNAPTPAPVVPPASSTPDFYPPRPATPPTPPVSPTPPQFYPPTPPPPAATAPPDFFPPRTPAPPVPPVEPVRPVGPPVAVKPLVVTPPPTAQAPDLEEYEEEDAPAKSPLGKILAIGGGLLLLALIWYLVAGQSRSSEHLTSISQTAADTVAVTPETGPQAEQLDLPPAAAPETVRVAPVIPPVTTDSAAVAASSGTTEDAPQATQATPPVTETKPAENTNEATDRVRDVLAAYYADIQAPPFNADQYFAPQVDLFVILRNTTPAAISAWLEQNRFAELKDAQFQVEPGSLRVAAPANDGSRVVTYIERGRGFRQSLQKNQYIRAQMRLRLNPDYKITYQKQERLLENTLTDPVAPPPTPE